MYIVLSPREQALSLLGKLYNPGLLQEIQKFALKVDRIKMRAYIIYEMIHSC